MGRRECRPQAHGPAGTWDWSSKFSVCTCQSAGLWSRAPAPAQAASPGHLKMLQGMILTQWVGPGYSYTLCQAQDSPTTRNHWPHVCRAHLGNAAPTLLRRPEWNLVGMCNCLMMGFLTQTVTQTRLEPCVLQLWPDGTICHPKLLLSSSPASALAVPGLDTPIHP